ncbi:MAG: AMP-binding protein, partial [Bacteroidales bacterium]|nr:AMP-binding protein [Bacteroidales bacterium]
MVQLLRKIENKAISHNGRNYSFTQLLQHSSRYASVFSKDMQPQKVLIFAENSAEWIFALYGTLRSGAIAIPVDVQSTKSEVEYIVNDCRPDIVFTTPAKREMFAEVLAKLDFACTVLTEQDIPLDSIESEPAEDFEVSDVEKTMLIIYTSGTTGSPKGVMLSYKNVLFNVDSVSKSVKIFTEKRNTMILLPLHHAFPLMGSLVAPLYVGGTVYIAEGLNAESILKTLNEGKINIIIGVPRLYELLTKGVMDVINKTWLTRGMYSFAKAVGAKWLSKLLFAKVHKKFGGHIDYLVSGGASLPHNIGEILKTLGFTVLEGYGMTETAPMISFTRPWNVNVG